MAVGFSKKEILTKVTGKILTILEGVRSGIQSRDGGTTLRDSSLVGVDSSISTLAEAMPRLSSSSPLENVIGQTRVWIVC